MSGCYFGAYYLGCSDREKWIRIPSILRARRFIYLENPDVRRRTGKGPVSFRTLATHAPAVLDSNPPSSRCGASYSSHVAIFGGELLCFLSHIQRIYYYGALF